MAKITFITADGQAQTIDAAAGRSVMEAAVKASVAGIEAECGGACSCATCHVYIDGAWADIVGRATPMEEGMLEFSDHKQDGSRLACQLRVTDALDGLVLHIPPTQG